MHEGSQDPPTQGARPPTTFSSCVSLVTEHFEMRLVLVEMLGHLASQSYLSEEYEYGRDKLGGSVCLSR